MEEGFAPSEPEKFGGEFAPPELGKFRGEFVPSEPEKFGEEFGLELRQLVAEGQNSRLAHLQYLLRSQSRSQHE